MDHSPEMLNWFTSLFIWQRRGVVGGIDYGFTGEVKKIDVSRIRERLDRDSIVVVSNMGYSSAGEVLNCKYATYPIHIFSFVINFRSPVLCQVLKEYVLIIEVTL
jgi:hypothetical protein